MLLIASDDSVIKEVHRCTLCCSCAGMYHTCTILDIREPNFLGGEAATRSLLRARVAPMALHRFRVAFQISGCSGIKGAAVSPSWPPVFRLKTPQPKQLAPMPGEEVEPSLLEERRGFLELRGPLGLGLRVWQFRGWLSEGSVGLRGNNRISREAACGATISQTPSPGPPESPIPQVQDEWSCS